ncbi:hypothetical protein SLE2022_195730 [Rubroshorea leprosula]
MAQSGGEHPKTSPIATQTIQQLFRASDSPQKWSQQTTPSFKDHNLEDDHGYHHPKKSVLAKVKEMGKKLRQSLSKKKHVDGDNNTPSWGVRIEDVETNEEEDLEFLGAPMYESELAPEGYDPAKQNLREVTAIPEKHVLPGHTNLDTEQEKEKHPGQNKTLAEAKTQKPDPAYSTKANTTLAIPSKIQTGLTISVGGPPKETEKNVAHETDNDATEESRSRTRAACNENEETQKIWDKSSFPKEKIWDQGVSVKDHIMNRLEPGEDEKALSWVISDAMSPRSAGDVVGNVKEAVNSLVWCEKPAQSNSNISHSASNSSTHIPIPTNAQEVIEEESHGRIFQAN